MSGQVNDSGATNVGGVSTEQPPTEPQCNAGSGTNDDAPNPPGAVPARWELAIPTWCIPADRQAVFDRVWHGLKAQGRPAYDGGCMYRTDDGAKCAIGLFIPDGHPAQRVQGGVNALHAEFPELFEAYDYDFLTAVQAAHDSPKLAHEGISDAEWLERCLARLRVVAFAYDLTVPVEG